MRKYWTVIICLLLALFFAVEKSVFYKNMANNEFRIDVSGKKNSETVEIYDVKNINFQESDRRKNYFIGQGRIIDGAPTVKIKALKQDTISIYFMGPDIKKQSKNLHINVAYKDIIIDGQPIITKTVYAHHNKPYEYKIKMKTGQTIDFSVMP